jgi:ribosomal protein S12 methylthiotransferase
MQRGSHGEAFLKLLGHIRATIPGVALRTSFIVGFPGETETDFQELYDFVRAAEFDWMGVFCYSDVENGRSHSFEGKVPEEVARDRRNRLMAIQKKISARKLKRCVGKRYTALFEGVSRDSELLWEARLEAMAPEIDGKLYVNDVQIPAASPAPGDVVAIEVTAAHAYDLVGRVAEILEPPRHEEMQGLSPDPEAVRRLATGAPLRILA